MLARDRMNTEIGKRWKIRKNSNTSDNKRNKVYIYYLKNKWVFRLVLNFSIVSNCFIFSGRLFHSVAAANTNERSP